MSKENVEVGKTVRRLFAAFNRRDWRAFSAELDAEVEYAPAEEDSVYRGPEAVTQYAKGWLEAWDTFLGEVEEIESTPVRDRAFVVVRFRGGGKGSGAPIDTRGFWVCELRGGRLHRIRDYTDRADALEAAGLSE